MIAFFEEKRIKTPIKRLAKNKIMFFLDKNEGQ